MNSLFRPELRVRWVFLTWFSAFSVLASMAGPAAAASEDLCRDWLGKQVSMDFFIDSSGQRQSLRGLLREGGVLLYFVRTHGVPDIVIGVLSKAAKSEPVEVDAPQPPPPSQFAPPGSLGIVGFGPPMVGMLVGRGQNSAMLFPWIPEWKPGRTRGKLTGVPAWPKSVRTVIGVSDEPVALADFAEVQTLLAKDNVRVIKVADADGKVADAFGLRAIPVPTFNRIPVGFLMNSERKVGGVIAGDGGIPWPAGRIEALGATQVAFVNEFGSVYIWDFLQRRQVRKLSTAGGVRAVAFTSGGRLAVSIADAAVQVWELTPPGGKPIQSLECDSKSLRCVAASAKEAWVAAGGTSGIWVWMLSSRKTELVKRMDYPAGSVESLAISPNGATLAIVADDRSLRLWDVAGNKQVALLSDVLGQGAEVAFSPDGTCIVCGENEPAQVRVWNVKTGAQSHKFEKLQSGSFDIAMPSRGTVWLAICAESRVTIVDLVKGATESTTKMLEPPRRIVLTRDGRYVLALTSAPRVWDVRARTFVAFR